MARPRLFTKCADVFRVHSNERLEKIYDTATKNHWYHDSYDPEIYALSSTDKVFDIASTTVEHLHNINKDHSIPIYVAPNNTRSESLKFLNSDFRF